MMQELAQFFGKVGGMAVRHNLPLGVDLAESCWKQLAGEGIDPSDVWANDTIGGNNIREICKLGLAHDEAKGGHASTSGVDDGGGGAIAGWEDVTFVVVMPDGSKLSLLPGGEEKQLTYSNWRQYVSLIEHFRLAKILLKANFENL